MKNLRGAPARPARTRLAPAYPRILTIGALLLAGAGCGGTVLGGEAPTEQTPPPPEPTPPDPAGGIAIPFEETGMPDAAPETTPDTADARPDGADAGPAETAETEPPSAGNSAYPFDADIPLEAAKESAP